MRWGWEAPSRRGAAASFYVVDSLQWKEKKVRGIKLPGARST